MQLSCKELAIITEAIEAQIDEHKYWLEEKLSILLVSDFSVKTTQDDISELETLLAKMQKEGGKWEWRRK